MKMVFGSVLGALLFAGTAAAHPPACWCPNDFCPKLLPPAPCPLKCWRPDDYCRKKLPPVPCPARFVGVDDYCPKKLPPCPGPVVLPWYRCGPTDTPCPVTPPAR